MQLRAKGDGWRLGITKVALKQKSPSESPGKSCVGRPHKGGLPMCVNGYNEERAPATPLPSPIACMCWLH